MQILKGFPPSAGGRPHTLILGSMPGVESLNQERYYAHPRNAFWPIMGELFGAKPELPYDERLTILIANGIALWDVIGSCERKNSLDSDIVEASIEVNDFTAFFAEFPTIQRIFFNGGKAEQAFKRYVVKKRHPGLPPLPSFQQRLPSTSPANARMNLAAKNAAWREALAV